MSSATVFSLTLMLLKIAGGSFASTNPKLLVVSYDAFRYDYFNRNVTPYMNHLKNEGTHVDYMKNIFVTKTFPNHQTMATGLYAEDHGVVDNEFYDEQTGNVTKYSYELYHYDNRTTPIWTLNEKGGNGRRSGAMMWPGGLFEYAGITPTFSKAYDENVTWKDRVDTVISWFAHPLNPINFAVLYIEEPDYHGHVIGIHSPKFNEILNKLDGITKYLHEELQRRDLDDVNVVHLSDHGMATVTLERIVDLNDYVNQTDYKYVGTSPGLHVYPNPGKFQTIYDSLKTAARETKKFRVYKREEIPKKYRYGNNPRVGPIFVIAEVGYAFQNLLETIEIYKKKYNMTVDDKSEFGLHGYDNEDNSMLPMFFGKGPAFVPRCKLNPFNNTDLLTLFCKILELDCPLVNETSTNFDKCLRKSSLGSVHLDSCQGVCKSDEKPGKNEQRRILHAAALILPIVGLLAAGVAFLCAKRRRKSKWKTSDALEAQPLCDEFQEHENVRKDVKNLSNFA